MKIVIISVILAAASVSFADSVELDLIGGVHGGGKIGGHPGKPGKPFPGKPHPGKPGKPHPGKPQPGHPFPGKPQPGGPFAIEVVTQQYAAQMTLVRQLQGKDGFATRRIFANRQFYYGDKLVLEQASGVSIGRIHDGKAAVVHTCPQAWQIHFTDRFGNIIGYEDRLEYYYGRAIPVPAYAVAAYIGYDDTAYFDNEGKRWAKYGSTGGCQFRFRIVR